MHRTSDLEEIDEFRRRDRCVPGNDLLVFSLINTKAAFWRLRNEANLAGPTGLEPATSGVTGRRSNQLNYDPAVVGKLTNPLPGGCIPPREARIVNGGRGCVKGTCPLCGAGGRRRPWATRGASRPASRWLVPGRSRACSARSMRGGVWSTCRTLPPRR